ncbi:SCO7613 C-terminal domain-containing membrane protein [Nocardioides sp.]|uniref:SCO7613 C-terminal domain-containing membrane protein n=1 Tax=Nocardioides sp. TaxID=35761 RepID=UPI002B278FB4|nr:hypothetical protein [Nocardioides sp.]
MPRYADPALCPDCGATLPVAPETCPACALPLRGPVAGELLSTLQHADELLVQLRSSAPASSDASLLPGMAPASTTVSTTLPPRQGGRGLSAPSVPKILLGLGAACLLVAAVIFLAVAWSWLGIGGRTAVLVAATVASAAVGVRLGRRGLRIAGEAFSAIALGLLVLDLVGAENAGWLGDISGSALGVVIGLVVAAVAVGLLTALGVEQRPLVVPQAAIVVGLLLATGFALDLTDTTRVMLVIDVLACAAVVRLALGRRVPVVVVGLVLVGMLWWTVLISQGFIEALVHEDEVTLRSLWVAGDVHGYGLLAAVVLSLLPIAVVPGRDRAWQVAIAVAGLVATPTALFAALDNGATAAAAAWGVALLVWTLIAVAVDSSPNIALAARATMAVRVPLALSAVVVVGFLAGVGALGTERLLVLGEPFTRDYDVTLGPLTSPVHPALVVPGALVLLVAAYVALRWRRRVPEVAGLALLLAALTTLVQYDVWLGAVVATLVAAGLVAVGVALRASPQSARVEPLAAAVATVLLGLGVVVALPSATLTVGALALLLAAASTVLLVDGARTSAPTLVGHVAGAIVPLALAGLVWSIAEAAGASDAQRAWAAAVVLVGVGVLAIVLPRVEIEVAAAAAAIMSVPISVVAATDESVAWSAYLTLAGVLVTTTALVHRDRRKLAIPGGLLLAAATWVRLHDLGVSAPEPYTLPLALVLVAVGIVHLRREPDASTRAALLPGLLLATVPSLLWSLEDPLSWRALLLGLVCLALVLAGAQLRWGSPLVVGAVVGALLVIGELAPYSGQVPQWVVIGLAGALLTVVGVTWERRLQDLRRIGVALGRLR